MRTGSRYGKAGAEQIKVVNYTHHCSLLEEYFKTAASQCSTTKFLKKFSKHRMKKRKKPIFIVNHSIYINIKANKHIYQCSLIITLNKILYKNSKFLVHEENHMKLCKNF
ncbi:hypothetical protein EDEG_01529 [Edhazardia aedis USNM 41457]|uniref:Uncharacterized protein n=1 Tax=Edhazardia aedis (strain USNM 41457) TaxID=1003232 RepID=J9D9K4_EDHAE|nr:hypothetical protein EDEG_01529 [Edhazardia aedis USNM 41457]|eukprot:EJW04179.1 hypothetical protein EDEG_01529 [Edhazardia aedis USNM 41457]